MNRIAALVLCILMTAALVLPIPAAAKSETKNVRVGWYESPFNTIDDSGRRSGYAYEYQLKIADYAGWSYTYISASWTDLMEMLKDGKIDLMSDVSYTEERSREMLYADLPMGTEEYCIFISPRNTAITSEDYSTLNGKRIGVNKGSVQEGLYHEWAEKHDIRAEVVELNCTEPEAIEKLNSGALDAYITLNEFGDPEQLVPVCLIGASDFYFAVNNDRSDLLDDLNSAMNRIHDENPYYNQNMYEKYIKRFGTNAFLTSEEEQWLSSHGKIRVGYQDDYLAFCAQDPGTGELTGALKNYLEIASDSISNAHIDFEPIAYTSSGEAFEALKKGEVDCVFPSNLSAYDGERQEVMLSPSLMRTEVYAVVRAQDQHSFTEKEHVVAAVNENNLNYQAFLQESYPGWRAVYYPNTEDCLKSVADGVADCVLINSYRLNYISRLCKQLRLTTFAIGKGVDYCFAVSKGEEEMYSILSKTIGLVPVSKVNAALSEYISDSAKTSIWDFFEDNIGAVLSVTAVLLFVIILQLVRLKRSENKAKKLISATEIDELTGLYNRDYFFQYAERIYHEHPEIPRDAIVLNIEQFHSINALNGWTFGDQVLQAIGSEIRAIANEFNGICGRFGADRFDIYCRHIEDYSAVFDRLQRKLDTLSSNVSVRLRMGVMPWQEDIEPIELFDRARTACNMARGHYIDHLIIFDDKVREQELFDQQLLNDLRRALDEDEFVVYYQPKFDIRTDEPKLVGAEALIRWRHPELGLLNSDKFIPLFERNGKISEVERFVWTAAAEQIADWRNRYGVTIPISVNLSRVDIFDNELENKIDAILSRASLGHDALEIEITESAYTENADQLIYVTNMLHRKGYTIEMDDFGTGYSSLNMLSSLSIDVLKMDRSFIENIENSEKDKQMVSLIIGIAESMDIPVIAEGVETESQIQLLKSLGCSSVQGYYFSRPLHPSDFESEYLSKSE